MRRALQIVVCIGALIAVGALAAGCGSSSGGGSFTASAKNSAKISTTIPKSGCGAVATPPPKDPDGVVAGLPASYQAQYAGYSGTVSKSPWSNFKPDHGPPYTVGISFAQLSNATQSGIFNSIKKSLEADPNIKVTAVTTSTQLNIPQQLQQYSSLVDQGVDLMIVEPLTDAFGDVAAKAAKQNIPTISVLGSTTSPYSVNVTQNGYGQGAQAASVVVRQMEGKGNTLYMHGIASTNIDQEAYQAYQLAVKSCPGVKEAGQAAGAFVSPTAKAETLKFLASHPESIDGVVETGGMAPGIISAFQQAGRPVPLVTDVAGLRGSLGFWANNKDNYHGFGQGFPPGRYGAAIASVARRMLAGRGVKLTDIVQYQPTITQDNLDQWGKTQWNLTTPGGAEGPDSPNFMSEDYLERFVQRPSACELGLRAGAVAQAWVSNGR